MLALSDVQLVIVMDAAADLSPEKRAVFLERVAARLQLRGSFTADDLAKAIRVALQGLTAAAPLPVALVIESPRLDSVPPSSY
jgi:hypothetical protein